MEYNNQECATCPYGKEEYERRRCFSEECRILFNKIDESDTGTFHDIFCDKTGGKVSIWGYCGDINSDSTKHDKHTKKKKSTKRERDIRYKTHLKYLSDISNYPKPAYYVDEIEDKRYHYIKNPKPYYKRLYRGKCSPYLKRISNRKIRRNKEEMSNGWYCHRLFDFWWEMY